MSADNRDAAIERSRTGQFAKGNPGGPGRPRGMDFRAVVTAKAEAEGISVEDAIWQIFQALLAHARQGDVQAAKLLIERLCGKLTIDVEIQQQQTPPMSDTERVARLKAILASAAKRESDAAATTALLG